MLSRQLMYCMCADKQFAQGTFFEGSISRRFMYIAIAKCIYGS